MAIRGHGICADGKREMTLDEFKRWMKKFDHNKDGRISRGELAEVIRISGGRFARLKARCGVKTADQNGNGYIDDGEIENLVKFAEKHLRVRIVHL